VVFLDADALVVRNMDDAFQCPGFCASLRHSERLNSGVMVLHPSETLLADMISKIDRLPSYTGCTSS
jgi:alpha-N-acetylglucosamine transferase